MALRLVRKSSDTPNITNKDDTIMTRYAYGGANGVVKGFGSECGYTVENGIFKVLDGEIIIDGWEIQIDGAGWSLNLSSVTGTQYHSIYAEINVSTESVKLDSTYLPAEYPVIEKGDDLTSIPNGTARLLLYNVKVENGTITEVLQRFEIIPYLKNSIEELESFMKTVVYGDLGDITYNPDMTYLPTTYYYTLTKNMTRVCLDIVFVGGKYNFGYASDNIANIWNVMLPQGFIPKKETVVAINVDMPEGYYSQIHVVISPNGNLSFNAISKADLNSLFLGSYHIEYQV